MQEIRSDDAADGSPLRPPERPVVLTPFRSPGHSEGRQVLDDWIRALKAIQGLGDVDTTLADKVARIAARQQDAPALIGAQAQMSYGQLVAQSNRYGRWAVEQGFAPGTVIGLLMPNDPDYVAIWLGLSRLGYIVALLNTNLPAEAIADCLDRAEAQHLIVAKSLAPMLEPIAERLEGAQLWIHGGARKGFTRLDTLVSRLDDTVFHPADRAPPRSADVALLIYTSGTTGLPKAARITHGRIMEWTHWFSGLIGAGPDDRLYDCLPMYHSVGGITAIGSMLVAGGSVVIREKFSAKIFWDDVAQTGCTIVQYIGELCRYLLRTPPSFGETAHRVRLCCGNGMRGDVWDTFQMRFAIPRIIEFYAATESNISLYNLDGRPGAIGRVPSFLAHRFPIDLIRCDPETNTPLRDARGLCVPCELEEAGEAIGRIGTAGQRRFDGYTDSAASSAKVLHDVFEPGDAWFRTGDLMRRDRAGFYYFVDRLGDTFRWKGENVSTAEVAAVLAGCPGIADAAVYGVDIPGTEGKAGMAALAVEERFTWSTLHDHIRARLPVYARPRFIRIVGGFERTDTLRLKKATLARQSYLEIGEDALWAYDLMTQQFVPCDALLLQRILAGEVLL